MFNPCLFASSMSHPPLQCAVVNHLEREDDLKNDIRGRCYVVIASVFCLPIFLFFNVFSHFVNKYRLL